MIALGVMCGEKVRWGEWTDGRYARRVVDVVVMMGR